MIRPDLLLSYWILAWYVAYMLGILTHNPKWALELELVGNILILIALIYSKAPIQQILLFALFLILLKVIPLWTIWHTKTRPIDIHATIGVFLMYIGWMIWEKEINVLYEMMREVVYLQKHLPEIYLMNQLLS
jgi:hypothetical protein